MKLTTNYGLKKPDASDIVNIDDFNYNADAIDSAIKEVKTKVDSLNLTATNVKMSDGSTVEDAVSANKTSILNVENNKINRIYNLSKTQVNDTTARYQLSSNVIKINTSGIGANVYWVGIGSTALNTTKTIYISAVKQGETSYNDYLLKVQGAQIPSDMENATTYDFNAGVTGAIRFVEYNDVKYAILSNVKYDYFNTSKVKGNILSNSDLNTFIDVGTYATSSVSISTTLINAPKALTSSYYCALTVKELNKAGTIISQELTASFNATQSRKFFRRYIDGKGWNDWTEMYISSSYLNIEETIIEQENKISILECENKALKEELTQIQTSIASLTSLITITLEEK